jgi:hypothetical protein
MKKTILILLMLSTFIVKAQWSNSSNNYTTGTVGIGLNNTSLKMLYVQSNFGDHLGLFENINTGGYGLHLRAANDPLRIVPYSGGSNYLFVVNGNGNVGIGRNTASYTLDVNGTIQSYGNLRTTAVGNGNGYYGDDGGGSTIFSITRQLNNEARFQSYGYHTFYSGGNTGSEKVRIDASGNVGIGTPAPAAKLEVNGDANIGSDAGTINGYGAKLQLLGASSNGDALWLSRFNNGSNQTELRVNIGDDVGQSQDMFVVGTHSWNGGTWNPFFAVQASGNVGIGTTSPDAKLTVSGQVHAQEVKVTVAAPGPDYVFEKDYKLTSLEEIKNYINQNKHLPEVPSAKEMEKNGVQLGEMNMLLLRKIEELTLHLIEQNKIIAELKERSVSPDPSGKKIEELTLYVIEIKKENKELKSRIESIENK